MFKKSGITRNVRYGTLTNGRIFEYLISFSLHKLQHDYLNNLYAPELLKFMARYKFIIAYENGVCHDYITEKFWRPLIAGSIPIYFGSPSIRVRISNFYK